MRAAFSGGFVVAAILVAGTATVGASDEMPWVFNAPRAEGYSIDLISIDPAPATPLVAGTKVDFKVSVKYSLTAAKEGVVVLVFQDEKNRNAKPDGEQVAESVVAPEGTLTLSDSITIPRRARELRLFIPLVPQGMSETTGEITIRWPISKK